jgi:hypothetical protein
MSDECTKAVRRRSRDPEFADRYLVGRGIDVGAGADGIGSWKSVFPKMTKVRRRQPSATPMNAPTNHCE